MNILLILHWAFCQTLLKKIPWSFFPSHFVLFSLSSRVSFCPLPLSSLSLFLSCFERFSFCFEHLRHIVVSVLIILHSMSLIWHFLSSSTNNNCFSPVRLAGGPCLRRFFPRETCIRSWVYFPWYLMYKTLNRQDARCTHNSTQKDHVTYIGYVYLFTIRSHKHVTYYDINKLSCKLVTRVDLHLKHNIYRTANSVDLERISFACHKTKQPIKGKENNTTRQWKL